jgi:hypothetical protein
MLSGSSYQEQIQIAKEIVSFVEVATQGDSVSIMDMSRVIAQRGSNYDCSDDRGSPRTRYHASDVFDSTQVSREQTPQGNRFGGQN